MDGGALAEKPMVTVVVTWVAVLMVIISVHELGHYLAAVIGGMRATDVRLRLLTFPQHVVFRDGDQWLGPFHGEQFHALCVRVFGLGRRYFAFVAGGLILQTVFVSVACLVAGGLGYRWIAWLIASESGILYAVYLFAMDLPLTLWKRWPWGDTAGMWWLSPLGAIGVAVAVLGVHALLMWHTFRALHG